MPIGLTVFMFRNSLKDCNRYSAICDRSSLCSLLLCFHVSKSNNADTDKTQLQTTCSDFFPKKREPKLFFHNPQMERKHDLQFPAYNSV